MKNKGLLLCLCLVQTLFGQVDSVMNNYFSAGYNDIEYTIEDFISEGNEETDCSDLMEKMIDYATHRININHPDYEALAEIGVSDWQLYNLQKYLSLYGTIYSWGELALIPGWSEAVVRKYMPFMELAPVLEEDKQSWKPVWKQGKHNLLLRYGQVLEPQAGYMSNGQRQTYEGKVPNYMFKYIFKSKDKLQLGLTAEKDAGEPFFKGKNKAGFDYYSMHFFVRNIKCFKSVALGSYRLSFGQGLSMNKDLMYGKPQNSVNLYRQNRLLKPHSSSNECNYLHGVATVIDCKVMDLLLFYSFCYRDAAIKEDSVSGAYITSLQQTGYHRTSSEIAGKNSVQEQMVGMYININKNVVHIGAVCYYSRYSLPLQGGTALYNTYNFSGKWNVNASIDYKILWRRTSWYGEVAMSANKGMATLHGLCFNLHPKLSFAVLYRYYSPHYQSLHAGAFGERSNNANEQGIYIGINAILSKRVTCNAFVDYFIFPWLTYRVDAPSDGWSAKLQFDYEVNRNCSMYLKVKYKTKALNYDTNGYNEIYHYNKQHYQFQCLWQPSAFLQLKTKIEVVNYQLRPQEKYHQGYWISEDVKWHIQRWNLALSARFALFDTYSYNERISVYEDDILYAFSVPTLYNKGCRMYLMLHYQPCKVMHIWCKIAQTYYRNMQNISSGLSEIKGQHKTDIKLQLQFKW